jgi:RIO kinase 2
VTGSSTNSQERDEKRSRLPGERGRSEPSSSIDRAARYVKTLKDEEWRTLLGLERASVTLGSAEPGMISRLARLPLERVRFAIDKLSAKEMVHREGVNFSLTQSALEALALKDYVRRDLVGALGAIIAKGKESDVYEAFTDQGGLLALKFFKLGRASFREVRRKRSVERGGMKSWMAVNYEAAKREYTSLKSLEGLSAVFPKAVAYNRSTVLLEELNGVRFTQMSELNDPLKVLEVILHAIRVAYMDAGLVNGDLSEYNILTDGEKIWIIDWPQSVDKDHPNAKELLARDVKAVLKFFKRRYGVSLDALDVISYVTGEKSTL